MYPVNYRNSHLIKLSNLVDERRRFDLVLPQTRQRLSSGLVYNRVVAVGDAVFPLFQQMPCCQITKFRRGRTDEVVTTWDLLYYQPDEGKNKGEA